MTDDPAPFYIAANGFKHTKGFMYPDIYPDNQVAGIDSGHSQYFVALATDGSRQVVDLFSIVGIRDAHVQADQLLDDNPGSDVHLVHGAGGDHPQVRFVDTWMDYDWNYSREVVNQIPYVQKWESHLCRIAHDVDQFNIDAVEFRKGDTYKDVPLGNHSAETQIRNQNTLQVFRAMIGNALRKLDAWANLDPALGGTGTFTTDWKEQLEGIRAIIEDKVCQACEHKFSAREFARLHDYSAWRTILDHRRVLDEETGSVIMRVPTIDRSSEPWQPHATENLAFFGGNNVEQGWRTAVDWYDEAIHRYDRLYVERYIVE